MTAPRLRSTALAIGAMFAVNGLAFGSWVPRLPEIRDALDIGDAALGLTLLGGGIGGLTMSLASGRIVDRVGSRATMVSTSVALSLLIPLIALAPSPPVLFAVLIAVGAVDGVTDVAQNAQAIVLQGMRERSLLSRMHAAWSIGTLLGGLIASRAAAAGISFTLQLSVTAVVLSAVCLLAAPRLLPGKPIARGALVTTLGATHPLLPAGGPSPTDPASPTAGQPTDPPNDAATPSPAAGSWPAGGQPSDPPNHAATPAPTPHPPPAADSDTAGSPMSGPPATGTVWTAGGQPSAVATRVGADGQRPVPRRLLATLFAMGVTAILIEMPPTEWAALVMAQRFDLGPGIAGLGFVAFAGGMVIGRLSGDLVVDRIGSEGTRRAGAALALVGVIVVALSPAAWVAAAGLFVAGVGASSQFPMAVRRAGELVEGSRGVALFSSGARAGMLLGPPLMGAISGATSRTVALVAVAGTAAVVSLLVRLPDAATQ